MERLNFKITLDTSYDPDFHETETEFSISVNEHTIKDFITEEKTLDFDVDCSGENVLSISLLNKTPNDVELDVDGNIIKDRLLHILKIEVDDIDITNTGHIHSEYDAGEFGIHRNCMNLGWNGTWKLEFDTPFYIWLLETL